MTQAKAVQVDERIESLNKGLGSLEKPAKSEEIVRLGWNLLREDLSLPSAVLYRDRVEHNLRWMQRFMNAYGARLAPHGKTTMAPQLFRRQLDAGYVLEPDQGGRRLLDDDAAKLFRVGEPSQRLHRDLEGAAVRRLFAPQRQPAAQGEGQAREADHSATL